MTNEAYASEIAEKWNAVGDGVGIVTRFEVEADFLKQYEIHQVGASHHTEYWIPSEDLDEFNRHIIGPIQMVKEFRPKK